MLNTDKKPIDGAIEVPVNEAGKILKNSSSNAYKCLTAGSGTSTVEPTQTSGIATESDGYEWEYLGAIAVFKSLNI